MTLLDFYVSENLLWGWGIGLAILLIIVVSVLLNQQKQITKAKVNSAIKDGTIEQQQTRVNQIKAEMEVMASQRAQELLKTWKDNELVHHRNVMMEAAADHAQSMLANWKLEEEKKFRSDAVKRSMGVNLGKITEHLIPFSDHLIEFNPRDVRFIGSPVDLLIFDGATEKKDEINIYLVEIKTGAGKLSKRQKSIKNAIDEHRVYWKPIVVPDFKWDVPDEEEDSSDDEPFQPAY